MIHSEKFVFFLVICFSVLHLSNAQTLQSINVTGTVRDFWPCTPSRLSACGKTGVNITCDPAKCHNDFENAVANDLNVVQRYLNTTDRKPIFNATANHPTIFSGAAGFNMWFRDVPGVNIPISINLTLRNDVCPTPPCDPNVYGFSSTSFFPINNMGFGNFADYSKNFAFTMEIHTQFTYRGNEVFWFTGDDDVWVFINNTLVVDLGGVHSAQDATVQLNTSAWLRDLVVNRTYPFDIFFAERHTSASNFRMYTSLAFTCPWYDHCGVCQGNGQTCCAQKCSDNNPCTIETCTINGTCLTSAVTCPQVLGACGVSYCDRGTGLCVNNQTVQCPTPNNQCANPTTCNVNTGQCVYSNKTDGTACNDNNLCSQDDRCQGGMCTGGNWINCNTSSLLGQCKLNGTCNPNTGNCTFVNRSNGTSCSDGNSCTLNDACQNGDCISGAPKVCAAPNQCQQNITCNTLTGNCDITNKPDSTTCNDANLCTQTDTCINGQCVGSNPVTCSSNGTCKVAGTCNPSTGVCSNPNAPDGISCSSSDQCTASSVCVQGQCTTQTFKACPAPPNQCYQAGICNSTSGVCSFAMRPSGSACNDSNACTLADSCQAGQCVGTAKVCPPPNQCQDRVDCDVLTGNCIYTNKYEGAPCDDGNKCTTVDVCVSGQCIGNSPVTCPAPQDVCNLQGTCQPDTGLCTTPKAPAGTVCDDRDACSMNSACDGLGFCAGTGWKVCDSPTQCENGPGTCNKTNGACFYPKKAEGTVCSDNNACTQSDVCTQGVCIGSNPVQCIAPNGCQVNGTCQPQTGRCTFQNVDNFANCSDQNACTTGDYCLNGQCVGSPVTCATQTCKNEGVCNPLTGTCSYTNSPDGTGCQIQNNCVLTAACVSGVCTQKTAVSCESPNQCWNAGTCNSTTGLCSWPYKDFGTGCNDGNLCTATDACDSSGTCVGVPVQCPAPAQCKKPGMCNPANGTCVYDNLADGTSCDDGNACTLVDLCQSGTCVGTKSVDCPSSNQCINNGVCNTQTGMCEFTNKPDNTICNDLDMCSNSSVCIGGACTGKNWFQCPTPVCYKQGVCDSATGACNFVPLLDNTACDDGNPCTINDRCTGGVCSGSTMVCPSPDDCKRPGTCNPATAKCEYPPLPNGTLCDDGNMCTRSDTCMNGVCVGNNPTICSPGVCQDSARCDPLTGTCVYDISDEGTPCNDGDKCTQTDICINGQCQGTNPVICSAPGQCYEVPDCDSDTGKCGTPPPKAKGTACNDNNLCTSGETCSNGVCGGGALKTCAAPDDCKYNGTCNVNSGLCVYQLKSGTSCDDGNVCTKTDRCVQGTCIGNLTSSCSGAIPYILLTNKTSTIYKTQSAWLALYFRALDDIPSFRVTVTNYPRVPFGQEDNRYQFGYVQYPSNREYTMLWSDEYFPQYLEDFVAIKLNPPMNQAAGNIYLDIQVNYLWKGQWNVGYHRVTVPTVDSSSSFRVDSSLDFDNVYPGRSKWFPITFTALTRMLDFQLTAKADVVSFGYPDNTGKFSSFYLDSFINVGVQDYIAVRVDVPPNAELGTVHATLNLQWITTVNNTEVLPASFTIRPPPSNKRDSSDVEFLTPDVDVYVGKNLFSLITLRSQGVYLRNVAAKLDPVDGMEISYPYGLPSSPVGDISEDETSFAAFEVKASQVGSFSTQITIEYEKNGVTMSASSPVTFHAKDEPISFLSKDLEIPVGKSSISIPFESQEAVNNVQVQLVAGPPGLVMDNIPSSSGDKVTSWLVAASIDTADIEPGKYPVTLSFTADGVLDSLHQTGVFMLDINKAGPPPSTTGGQPSTGGNEGNGGSDKPMGVIIGIPAAAGTIALVAGIGFLVYRHKQSKVAPITFSKFEDEPEPAGNI